MQSASVRFAVFGSAIRHTAGAPLRNPKFHLRYWQSYRSFSTNGFMRSLSPASVSSIVNQKRHYSTNGKKDDSEGEGNNTTDTTKTDDPATPSDTTSESEQSNKTPESETAENPSATAAVETPPADQSAQIVKVIKGGIPTELRAIPLFSNVGFPGIYVYPEAVPHLQTLGPNFPSHVALFLVKQSVRDKVKNIKEYVLSDVADIHSVGVIATVGGLRGNTESKLAYPISRASIESLVSLHPLTVRVKQIPPPPQERYGREVRARFSEITHRVHAMIWTHQTSVFAKTMTTILANMQVDDMALMADAAAAACLNQLDDAQRVLEMIELTARQDIVLHMLQREEQACVMQEAIGQQMNEKSSKHQRKYFLNEQLKAIKKELGLEQDEKEALSLKFKERLKGLTVPEEAQKVIDEELDKFKSLESVSSEYNVTRNYLDWLTQMPWNIQTENKPDIKHARAVLEKDHYGMADVKSRILEFIAVGKLNNSAQGSIILLVGPPGVGKTSIGKSIASALKREFFRVSVGGLSDVSEIKGHRRTYIGAMPGKFVQGIKVAKTSNPVILIDEIDKMGRGNQGDPAAALLELLDPEQNKNFLDHYLDVPFDMSKVLFVCTANMQDTIPKPLLDRMEVIQLSGYIPDEQFHIAKKYLIPTCRQESGLTEAQVQFSDVGIKSLVKSYSREAGVRKLRQFIERVFRKAAHTIVSTKSTEMIEIDDTNLEKYAGKPRFSNEKFYEQSPIGVVMGLAYTENGGASLYIETVVDRYQKAQLLVTGKLGDVMKESSSIAYMFAKACIGKIKPNHKFFETTGIHMHSPEGATPKDGPSAGCAIVTALLSLAMGKPVASHFALTGEITLTGKVLPIGGLREKLIAAKRAGVKDVCVPLDNKKDYDDIPANVREGIKIHFAEIYDDVFKVAFPGVHLRSRLSIAVPHRDR